MQDVTVDGDATRVVVVRWLGVRWYGLPMPLRVWGWLRVPGFARPWELPGCGCVVVLKDAWERVKAEMRAETWGLGGLAPDSQRGS